MPRINRGALAAIVGFQDKARTEQSERRKFVQDLVKTEIEKGRARYDFQSGQIMPIQQQPFDPSTLRPGQTFRQDVSGGTLTTQGESGKERLFREQVEAQEGLQQAQAVQSQQQMVSPQKPLVFRPVSPLGERVENTATQVSPVFQAQQKVNQLGGITQNLQQRGLLTRNQASPTTEFRQDIIDAMEAYRTGKISFAEIRQRLLNKWPDKINLINQLESQLF